MLDAFYLNTEDLLFYPIPQNDIGYDPIDYILAFRNLQRKQRRMQSIQNFSPVREFATLQNNQSTNQFARNSINGAIFNKQMIQQYDNSKSAKTITGYNSGLQIYAVSQDQLHDKSQYQPSIVSPGVVPAGNSFSKIGGYDNESDLHKIYSQKQYTEIALSILNSLKGPTPSKKLKSIRNSSRGGSLQHREQVSSQKVLDNSNSIVAQKDQIYKQSGNTRNNAKSFKERILNVVSEYDTHNSQFSTQRASLENPKKFSQLLQYKNSNNKDYKQREQQFRQEYDERYQQLKNESHHQWEQSFGQFSHRVSNTNNYDTNKLLKSYQKKGLKPNDQYDNNGYFSRRNLTNVQGDISPFANDRSTPMVGAKYDSYGVTNTKLMNGSITNRAKSGMQSEMPQISNQKTLKNSKSATKQQQQKIIQKSNSKPRQNLISLNDAINKNKFS